MSDVLDQALDVLEHCDWKLHQLEARRLAAAIQARKAGATWQQIATAGGWSSRQAAQQAIGGWELTADGIPYQQLAARFPSA